MCEDITRDDRVQISDEGRFLLDAVHKSDGPAAFRIVDRYNKFSFAGRQVDWITQDAIVVAPLDRR